MHGYSTGSNGLMIPLRTKLLLLEYQVCRPPEVKLLIPGLSLIFSLVVGRLA